MTQQIVGTPNEGLLQDDWQQFDLGTGTCVRVNSPFSVWASGAWREVPAGSYDVGQETAAAWKRRAPDRVSV